MLFHITSIQFLVWTLHISIFSQKKGTRVVHFAAILRRSPNKHCAGDDHPFDEAGRMLHSIVGLERALRVTWRRSADGTVVVSTTRHFDEQGKMHYVNSCQFICDFCTFLHCTQELKVFQISVMFRVDSGWSRLSAACRPAFLQICVGGMMKSEGFGRGKKRPCAFGEPHLCAVANTRTRGSRGSFVETARKFGFC